MYCGERIYEGYRHHCRMCKDGVVRYCECDEEDSPYSSCDECPWYDELELEEEE
jgi:hypothetical protein